LMVSKACVVGIYQRKLELIAEQGVQLLTIVPPSWRDERGEMILERAYTDGYTLDVLPIRFNGNFHLHHYVGLGKRVRDFAPHIVHIDEEPYNIAAWPCLKLAQAVNAKTLFFSWQNLLRSYPPPFNWGERWILNNVDYALMGTDSAGDIWREKNYTGKMRTIPQFGTDTDLFKPAVVKPERPFTMGYIGRLVVEKGVHLLIEAAAKLDGGWRLRILGSGPYLDMLKRLVHQHQLQDRVNFDVPLPSTEIPAYYHKLDALVLPSITQSNWKEQFGRVLVEAMASGVAVIGSDSGAIPGVIGDAGLIFPEGDVDALAEHLSCLQKDANLRQQLAHKGRQRVETHVTHQQVADATVDVYHELMKRST